MGFGEGWGQIIGPLIGTGLGLALEDHNDKRQLRQQQALTNQQKAANMDLMDYQQQKNLEQWEKTNYSAQVAQMMKAGVNPALLYAKGGGGGGTAMGVSGSSVGGAQAPAGGREILDSAGKGMEVMMNVEQTKLMKAQRENLAANTAKQTEEAANLAAERPNYEKTGRKIEQETKTGAAQEKSLLQGIESDKAKQKLLETQNKGEELNNALKSGTLESAIQTAKNMADKTEAEVRSALAQANVDENTIKEKIGIAKANLANEWLRGALIKAQTANTNEDTAVKKTQELLNNQEWAQNVQRLAIEWDKMDQKNREIAIQKLKVDADIRDQEWGQIMDGIKAILGGTILGKLGSGRTIIEGFKQKY